jgi:hypothetical protein
MAATHRVGDVDSNGDITVSGSENVFINKKSATRSIVRVMSLFLVPMLFLSMANQFQELGMSIVRETLILLALQMFLRVDKNELQQS